MLAFVDIETTGLDPERHEVWEIAVISRPEGPFGRVEGRWLVRPDLTTADPRALQVNHYYERANDLAADSWEDPFKVAADVAYWLSEVHLVGMNPAFDAAFLEQFLRRYDQAPAWSYHLIDAEALVAGWLAAQARYSPEAFLDGQRCDPTPPWRSSELSRAIGVEPDRFDRHTALGDARWAEAVFDAVMGSPDDQAPPS